MRKVLNIYVVIEELRVLEKVFDSVSWTNVNVRMRSRRLFDVKWSDSSHWIHVFIKKPAKKQLHRWFAGRFLYVWARVGVYWAVNEMQTVNVFCCLSVQCTRKAPLSCSTYLLCSLWLRLAVSDLRQHSTVAYWRMERKHIYFSLETRSK